MNKAIKIAAAAVCLLLVAAAGGWWWTSQRGAPPTPKPTPKLKPAPAPVAEDTGVSGSVRRATGEPISGAAVVAIPTGPPEGRQRAEVKTDAQGAFALPKLEPGAWRVDASAEGLMSAGPPDTKGLRVEVLDDGRGVSGVELVLREPVRVAGKVIAQEKPVPNARVGLYVLFADGVAGPVTEAYVLDGVTRTDAEGAFNLLAPPGRSRVIVEAEGYPLRESRQLYATEGKKFDDVVIDLTNTGGLSGLIVDSAGRPVRATVLVEGKALSRTHRATADGRGAWAVSELIAGPVSLRVKADGYRAVSVAANVVKGKVTAVEKIVMAQASGLFGRVLDPSGKGVPGAMIYFYRDGKPFGSAYADAKGAYERRLYGQTGAFEAVALSRAHADSKRRAVTPGEESVLELGEGGKVIGRVSLRGKPVTSYRIGVEEVRIEGPVSYFSDRSGVSVNRADGTFTLGPLRPGVYFLRAAPNGLPPSDVQRVEVVAGKTQSQDFEVSEGATITGKIVAEKTGEPISGAFVQVFEPGARFSLPSGRTGEDGTFKLEGVASGRRSVRVTASGYMTQVDAGVSVPTRGSVHRVITLSKADPRGSFSFHGIGASLQKTDKGIVVMKVMDNMPASAYGVKDGDVILSVDREDVGELRLNQVIEKIRGEADTQVTLEIEREGAGRMTIEITRGKVVAR